MFSAYFDESESGERLLIVGGVVSESGKWVEFTRECDDIREYFRIRHFHAQELLNPKSTDLYGHLTTNGREKLLGCLLSAIRKHGQFSLCAVIRPYEYKALTTNEFRGKHGSSYGICVHTLLTGLSERLIKEGGKDQTVSTFFERPLSGNSPKVDAAMKIVNDYKASAARSGLPEIGATSASSGPRLQIGMVGSGTKDDSPPLWASDLLTHCMLKQLRNPNDELSDNILSAIEETVPCYSHGWNKDRLKALVEGCISHEADYKKFKRDSHRLVKYFHQFGIIAHEHPSGGIEFDASGATEDQLKRFEEDRPVFEERPAKQE